jgi:hypothetical protein
MDNTLYEDVAGTASNGEGSGLFNDKTGVNDGFHLRRAVVAFDLSAIPSNALIDSVSVTFTINQVPPGSNSGIARPHRLQQDWGEGASEPATRKR